MTTTHQQYNRFGQGPEKHHYYKRRPLNTAVPSHKTVYTAKQSNAANSESAVLAPRSVDHASCSQSTARTTVKQRKLDAFLPGRRQARTSTVANSHAGSEGVFEKTRAIVVSSQSAISDKGKNKEHGDPRSKRENVATPAVFKTLATTADPVPAPAHSAATAGTIGTDNRTCALTDYHVAHSVDMPTSALAPTPTSVPATTDVAAEPAGDSTTTRRRCRSSLA